ncbi:MAG: DM13 domain-containing protein [Alphaproteobacteria bacterium GM7ARS4]|nr:DM13 domain-containing protein [Alphaproteobacteria bacterium GM7ARS4]
MKIQGSIVIGGAMALFMAGTGFGFALGIFFFPFLFPQAMEIEEPLSSPYGEGMPSHKSSREPSQAQMADEPPSTTAQTPSSPPSSMPSDREVAQGTFIHVNKWDLVHWGKGDVVVYEDKVVMAEDFEVGPGPKYHVYLSKAEQIEGASDVEDNPFVDLGRLRRFKGMQSYQIPSSVSLLEQGYRHVVIWCEAFGVLISPALLRFDDGV